MRASSAGDHPYLAAKWSAKGCMPRAFQRPIMTRRPAGARVSVAAISHARACARRRGSSGSSAGDGWCASSHSSAASESPTTSPSASRTGTVEMPVVRLSSSSPASG